MEKINALGKPCPIPVIETKKALRSLGNQGGIIEILVDNEVARQNIEKMAAGMGIPTSYRMENDNQICVKLIVSETERGISDKQASTGLVITFGKQTMGDGDPDLGSMLLKSYIYSLTELDEVPQHLLFFNSGAYLTNQASDVLKDLQALAENGTMISTCGACLDFYGLKETLAVGEITNMYGISETIAQADKLMVI